MSKKTIRNTIILSLAAIVLVVATVLTTLAYMTASAVVANTFTVGDVAISMYESKTDDMGNIIESTEGVKTSTGNHYTLVPGHNYVKDPTIYINSMSEDSYLFIVVRNDIAPIEENHAAAGAKTIAQQLADNGWRDTGYKVGNDPVYVFTKKPNSTIYPDKQENYVWPVGGDGFSQFPEDTEIVDEVDVFGSFTIEHEINQEVLKLYTSARVTITAYAIQHSSRFDPTGNGAFGTETAVKNAWDALISTYGELGGPTTTPALN